MTQSEEKNQRTEAYAEMSQMQNQLNMDIETANVIRYHTVKKTEENINMLRRDTDDTLKNPNWTFRDEEKTMSKMKNTMDGTKSRLETVKKKRKINGFEDNNFKNYPKWNQTK